MKDFNMIHFWVLEGAVALDDWSESRKEAIRNVVNELRPDWMDEVKRPTVNQTNEKEEDKRGTVRYHHRAVD